jgi:phospholipase/carboxylesterase
MQFEEPVIIGGQKNPQAAVIWLHGLGADGYDFEPIVPQLQFANRESVRFIFPHANVQPVTINAGMSCRAWFDIYSLSDVGNEDVNGMNETNHYIHSLIEQQLQDGIDSKKIVLVGFSQGGAMALYSALTYDKPLGGVMGLSTLLGGSLELEKNRNDVNDDMPILLVHGTQDEVLPYAMGERSRDTLESWGYKVQWKSYQMGHSLCSEEIKDISSFLQEHL